MKRIILIENSHCEWLIQPTVENNSQVYISLQFSLVATECSYDYIFVYDGDSYQDKLLGSFSGRVRMTKMSPCQLLPSSSLVTDESLLTDGKFRLDADTSLLRHKLRDGGILCQLFLLGLSQQLFPSRRV